MAERYDLKKLRPGWKARFVVHDHDTITQRGIWKKHFDLRLELPVPSLRKALKAYLGKREFDETKEPTPAMPDKPGTVARSWALPKATWPKVGQKYWAAETEPHDVDYMRFRGTIGKPGDIEKDPDSRKRLYGEGRVDIWDSGTFEILDVDYDKRYVIKLTGRKGKAGGLYALVKFKQGHLLVRMDPRKEGEYRARHKEAGFVDRVVLKFLDRCGREGRCRI